MKTPKSVSAFLLGSAALAIASVIVGVLGISLLQALPWSPAPPHLMDNYHPEGVAE